LAAVIGIGATGSASSAPRASPSQVSAHQATSQNKKQNGDAPKDEYSAFFHFVSVNHDPIEAVASVAAVGAAIWLAVVTGFLWGATNRLADSTDDLAKGGREQTAELAKDRELAEKQFLMEGQQADLMAKRHGLQRLHFLAEHRPRIEIRSIGFDTSGSGPFLLSDGEPIKGHLVIRNVGGSDATIKEAEYRFFWTDDGLPMVPPLHHGQSKPLITTEMPHVLPAHGSHQVPIESPPIPVGAASQFEEGGPTVLYILGAIRYSGWEPDQECWMGFCREYRRGDQFNGEGRFVAVENPDYEYSD
jgi:hypothetical protein